jgi:hypothetical protein
MKFGWHVVPHYIPPNLLAFHLFVPIVQRLHPQLGIVNFCEGRNCDVAIAETVNGV